MLAQSFQMIGCCVTLVASETILRVDGVPLFHASIAMSLRQDGGRGNGNTASVAFDERFLLDENVELHRVDEQVIRLDRELLQSGSHSLAAGLIDVPRVNPLGINFRDGPG